jgi:small subunit ribosomal protein S4
MEKRTRSISKFERRTGTNVLGKANSPVVKRSPKIRRKQPSYYGTIMDEVRKIRIFYGNLRYGMMKNIYRKAESKKGGDIIEKIVNILESRLLTIVYRLRWAKNPLAARQLVSHCHILVNGKVVNYGSYMIKVGDVISLSPKIRENTQVLEALNNNLLPTPIHLEIGEDKFSGKFLNIPKIAEINYTFKPNYLSLVEVFSK